ncbi:MAG: hypothetical protein FWE33_00810 [Defluviitaleaceae bacterium]|nr:hypothetical protein [Defluviitaleaceae bacterium]
MSNANEFEVSVRGGFSDRMGIKKENTQIQLTDFDSRTRTAIINLIALSWKFFDEYNGKTNNRNKSNVFLQNVLANLYNKQVDYSGKYYHEVVLGQVYSDINNGEYHTVLTIIEFISNEFIDNCYPLKELRSYFNITFEKEFAGYRFVNKEIVPITDEIEVNEIETASNSPYEEVNEHLSKSLKFLSDREKADYKNSIKESISSVERICSIIIGKQTELSKALKKLEEAGLNIHPALKSAFIILYGYTSDASGVRHSGQLGGANSTFEEAKFMLVSCCAFVNYIIGAISKLNLTN